MASDESRGEPDGPEGSDSEGDVHPRSYPVPGRLNLKRALRAYVHGHDRGWEAERKAELAAGDEEGYLGSGQALARGEQTERPGAGSDAAPEPGKAREGRRYGVPVPEELDFHRGADTWRDRIPRPHRARRPAGWPGEEAGGGEDRNGT